MPLTPPTEVTAENVLHVFRECFDEDRHGVISKDDFVRVLQTLNSEVFSQDCLENLIDDAWVDRNGKIQLEHFLTWLFSNDGTAVRDALMGLQFEPPRCGEDSAYFSIVDRWARDHAEAAARLIFEDTDENCLVLEIWGTKLQVFLPREGEPSFFTTSMEWEDKLCDLLTKLNGMSDDITTLPQWLTCASDLFKASFQQRAESLVRSQSAEPGEVPPQLALFREQSAAVANLQDVQELQRGVVQKASSALGVDSSIATMLLLHSKWDLDELLACLDRDALLVEAGITPSVQTNADNSEQILCCACFCDPAAPSLPCGHGLCKDCWPGFLKCNLETGTVDGQNCLRLKCPGELCSLFVPPKLFQECLEPCDYQRYQQLLAITFVKDSPMVARCPAVGCDLYVSGSNRKSTVMCGCGHYFCFACGQNAHEPVSCAHAGAWLRLQEQMLQGDARPDKRTRVKTCPNPLCATPTFKDRGCMWMACPQCKENWCWMCGHWGGGPSGRDAPHHVFKCNDPMNQFWGLGEGAEFYQKRSVEHLAALEFTDDLRQVVRGTVATLDLSDTDIKLICQAAEILIEYRQVLAWSYVWLYYQNVKETIRAFQDVQNDLETRIEKLSDMLEGNPKKPHAGWIWVNYFVDKDVGDELSSLIADMGGKPPDPSAELTDFIAALHSDVQKIRDFGQPVDAEQVAAERKEGVAPAALNPQRGRGRGRGRGAKAALRPKRAAGAGQRPVRRP